MAEEQSESARESVEPDSMALRLSLNAAGNSEEARAYLAKQVEIAGIQAEKLREEIPLERSHLKFRHFGDITKSAFEIAAGLVILLAVCALGAMVWNATQDHDLVVEAFSVPPEFANKGLTGQVLANRILDRYGAMGRNVLSLSQDLSRYHGAAGEEARVEIPETGISLAELNRYLRDWLGHETRVTGELVQTGDQLSLTVRYGEDPGTTATAPAADLDKLIQTGAENLFHAAEPLRFADYLSWHGNAEEGKAIAEGETRKGDDAYRALAYVSLGMNAAARGDQHKFGEYGELAARLDPHSLSAWTAIVASANNLEHEEEDWRAVTAALALPSNGPTSQIARGSLLARQINLTEATGDAEEQLAICRPVTAMFVVGCRAEDLTSAYLELHDIEKARDTLESSSDTYPDGKPNFNIIFTRVQVALVAGDISDAVALSKKAEALARPIPSAASDIISFLSPFEAEALARGGDIAGAKAVIGRTPRDCDSCIRARGRIEMIAKNWPAAAYWLGLVSARSPDIPFDDSDWGMMLLAKGDYAAAIAKFKSANRKGPHFPDPIEMWGEALMLQNRSDLALAKFTEAYKYAPNWGRLHMKWGEALFYAGRKDEARKQLAIAASLYLSAVDRDLLAKWQSRHY